MLKRQADQGYVPQEEKKIDPIVLEDNVIFLTRHDPFGHIFLTLQIGTLPEKYQGAYTDIKYARQDAEKYIAERKDIQNEKKKECRETGKKVTPYKTSLLEVTSQKPLV